jgi:hypothetical protein
MTNRASQLLFALLLLACATFVRAQVSPFQGLGNAQFFDNNGAPLTAGVLYSFQAGTSTQQPTYTDWTGTVVNPNPIPFASGARVGIWLSSGLLYKFVLCLQNDGPFCAPADVLFSVDQVPGGGSSGGGSSPFTGTFISGSPTPATSGILRLATADTICWRNAAGTANLCLSKTSNDVLTWPGPLSISSSANPATAGTLRMANFDNILWRDFTGTTNWGMSPNGTSLDALQMNAPGGFIVNAGFLRFTGITNAFPMLKRNGVGLNVRLADDSADASISASLGIFSAHIAVDGLTLTGSGCTAGQVIQASSPTAAGCVTLPSVQASSMTLLGGTVAISGTTTILTKVVTMPSSGCPCRAFASYSINFDATNAGQMATTVNDGTNTFATNMANTTGSNSNFSTSAASYSTGTYANNAVVTFTLQGLTTMAGTTNAHTGNGTGLGQLSWMNVAIFTSN